MNDEQLQQLLHRLASTIDNASIKIITNRKLGNIVFYTIKSYYLLQSIFI
jgi:hypothetical protein